MSIHKVVMEVTGRIKQRSKKTRSQYLNTVKQFSSSSGRKSNLSCGNIAHAFAASSYGDKSSQTEQSCGNLGIVTAYNDMLSAHQPYALYPDFIKQTAREFGGTAQVAGGVPAMCDGVTQGQPGMELSLFSRDVIAMSAAVALTHNVYDAAIFLGICDKIVPGLVIAAASFGHLPCIFLPSGPMPSGISNDQKTKVRQNYAAGKVGRDILLNSEMQAYHAPGTCTFYGTANSNQMLMELMGLQLPGSSFVNTDTDLRHAFNKEGVRRVLEISKNDDEFTPVSKILAVENFVNGIVGLHATGGSTNLLLHMMVMARVAGIVLDWKDFADLSAVTPLMARVYPNGAADVNSFRDAGGLQFIIGELLAAGLLHDDVITVAGKGLQRYSKYPLLDNSGKLRWAGKNNSIHDAQIVRPYCESFQSSGGLKLLTGNLGKSIIKVSALHQAKYFIEAPALVFNNQDEVKLAYEAGELERDFICVVKFQGPKSNGMPELHGLTPVLGLLQDSGYKVALLTDGRMSGASGKVPAAIHVSPEAYDDGPIAYVRNGDIIRLDTSQCTLDVLDNEFLQRDLQSIDLRQNQTGMGRDLFSHFRDSVGPATEGATVIF